MAVNASWICWAMGGPVGRAAPGWQLLAYNRSTGGVPLGNGPMPLWLAGNNVIWSAATARPPAGLHYDTFEAGLRGGAIRTLAGDALAAGVVGDQLFVTQYRLVAGTRAPGLVARIDLGRGTTTTLAATGGAIDAAAGPGGLIWITGQPPGRAVEVADLAGNGVEVISRGGTPQFPVAAGRLLLWDGYDAGLFGYDPAARRVFQLTTSMGFVMASGGQVFWTELHDPTLHWFVAPAT